MSVLSISCNLAIRCLIGPNAIISSSSEFTPINKKTSKKHCTSVVPGPYVSEGAKNKLHRGGLFSYQLSDFGHLCQFDGVIEHF